MEKKLEILTSVAVVGRQIGGLGGVESLVTDFLDASVLWTMPTACEKCPDGVARLLERIAAREDPEMDPLLKRWNFTMCLEKAIEKGNLEVVKWLVEEYLPEGRIRKPMRTAVKRGRLEILQWLYASHQDRVVWDPWMKIRDDLWTFHDLETLKWVHDNILPANDNTKRSLLANAVHYKHVDAVEWLDIPLVQTDLTMALLSGSIEMMEWIRDNSDVEFTQLTLDQAMSFGKVSIVEWLNSNFGFSTVSAGAVVNSILIGSTITLGSLEWVLDHFTIFNKEELARAIDKLAVHGRLEHVKKIQEVSGNGLCSTNAMDRAAVNGWLDMVKWLHENRSEGCTSTAMNGAAGKGHLDVVRWLHENRNEGCTERAMNFAARNGLLETIVWLHENRDEGCTTRAIDLAAANGHLTIVKFLHENRTEGCTPTAMNSAARYGHLDVVIWLHENRSEGCTYEAMNGAAQNGHLETVKWLYENRSEGCIDSAIHYATTSHQYEVMGWLYRREINDKSCSSMEDSIDSKFQYLTQRLNWYEAIQTVSGAEDAIWSAIEMYTMVEISWLLQQLPDYQFSSNPMMVAIRSNKLDIAMLLAKDGRFPVDIKCLSETSCLLHVEVFQWLARDLSVSIPEAHELIETKAAENSFLRDALIELQYLAANN